MPTIAAHSPDHTPAASRSAASTRYRAPSADAACSPAVVCSSSAQPEPASRYSTDPADTAVMVSTRPPHRDH
jgi:hypothetical protein